MNLRALILLPICLNYFYSEAQINQIPVGARSGSLGNITSTLQDSWGVLNNPAGISQLQNITTSINYSNRFSLSNFQILSTGVTIPLKLGVAGIGIQRLGNQLYNEQQVSIAYAHSLAGAALGIRVNYLQLVTQGLETRGMLGFDFGVSTKLSDEILLGASITNINQAEVTETEEERLPAIIRLGITYEPIESLKVLVEAEKDIEREAIFKFGVEYEFIKNMKARTGLSNNPNIGYFGLGILLKKFEVLYALNTHPVLNLSHHISIVYFLSKKSKIEKYD